MLDAHVLRAWARAARVALEHARTRVDAVNVFPVADGDTGTNVLLTVAGGADAVDRVPADADAPTVARAFAHGALLAARGNSGVIVSQYLAGFAAGLAGAGPGPRALAEALLGAARAARSAVADPQEGTVLTLADRVAAHAVALADASGDGGADPAGVLAVVLGRAHGDLVRISDEHPVLRREHVPDAGACALLVLLDALHRAATDAADPAGPPDWLPEPTPHARGRHGTGGAFEVMLVVRSRSGSDVPGGPDAPDRPGGSGGPDGAQVADQLRARVSAVGDSVAVVGADGVWHVHVHTDHPDAALAAAAVGAREQVVVRLVDGPHGAGGTADGSTAPGPGRWGLVVCTAAPALAAWYAAAGAVVLVVTPDAPVTAEHVARAVADTGAQDVALLPGGLVPAAALADRDGPVVEILDADDELRVAVAALAFASCSSASGVHAAVRALGRLRAVRVGHAGVLAEGLAEVLRDGDGEILTVLHRDPVDDAVVAQVHAATTAGGRELEHVLVGPTGCGPAFLLGVD